MKTLPNVKIYCPKHGLQISNPNAGHAVACSKCYPFKKGRPKK